MIGAVTHLIDDQSFGGINRMLDHMKSSKTMGSVMYHRVNPIKRGQLLVPKLNSDVIVSHLSICWANMPLFTALRGTYPNTKIIHVEHSYSQRFAAGTVENRQRFNTLLSAAYSLFDSVVAVSENQGQWLVRRGHCPAEKLHIIQSCVDLDPFFAVEKRLPSDRFVIGAIGRFHVQKGFDLLIKAFLGADREDMELQLFGDGPDREHLEYTAANHPRIFFNGYLADTSEALRMVDAVAMPSRWEPYGLVALEAMAAQRTVLTARIDGLNDHLKNGAIDIGENTVQGWAEFLAQCDPTALASIGPQALPSAKIAEQNFTNRWNSLLREAFNRNLDLAKAA